MSVIWAPSLAAALARPITSMFDGGDKELEPQPLYSAAIAKRKRGKFHDALREIQKQLERFPGDAAGQIMRAEIQAENLNDLPGAQIVIDRLCRQPGLLASSLAYALNQLADWHLKYGQDVEAARATLERIIALLPGSEPAQLAAQRIAHLASTDSLLATHDRPAIQIRAGVQNVGLLQDTSALRQPEADPAEQAAQHVKHLEQHPFDSEIREKLALLYAGHYQRLDLAIGELEQLIQQPNQPAKQVVHWLNLLADLQIKHLGDFESARQTLQRIIDLDPEVAAARIAQQRIEHLKLELRKNEKSQALKLGSYEQNIGLKKR
jgi:tetratricopeptide (TPR) repeat protein